MPNQYSHDEKPWRDEETLREEYVHKQRSSTELAEKWGCSHATVMNWVKKYGFDKYSRLPRFTLGTRKSEEQLDGSRHSTTTYEYLKTRPEGSAVTRVMHHRLLAVAEWGFNAVRGKEVHHQNNIPWDNRPDNLELLTKAAHSREHAQERNDTEMVDGEPWYSENNLQRLYHVLNWSTYEIADEYDTSSPAVRGHMDKHGIERRSMSEAQQLHHQDSQQQTLDSFSKRSTGDD